MDEETVRYYGEHSEELAALYEEAREGVSRYFSLAFPRGSRVLDLGAGSGRDAFRLADGGNEVYGVEPAAHMRESALLRHPGLAGRLFSGGLPSDLPRAETLGGPLDGVVCSAVLQHLPRHALFDSVFSIRRLLKPGGRALVSLPQGDRQLDARSRDSGGRFFNQVAPGEVQLLFERAGFTTVGSWRDDDSLGRSNITWATMLFALGSGGPARPLDLVSGVLSSSERKVATYKLALFRALCDIALTQPRLAEWRANGSVAIPVDAVALRWIRFYWPLFDTDGTTFLPQQNGEWLPRVHKLAFSRDLEALISGYSRLGGLSGFLMDERNGRMPPALARTHVRLLSALRKTIMAGPVTYAGGSLDGGRLFARDGTRIALADDLWRELSLMGHWIQDALILRWAELTARLSRGEVSVDRVVARLLIEPELTRYTADARDLYRDAHRHGCVWTGRSLDEGLDIDHVLPFSLWRNNDLWNLLPVHPRVNASKSDRLPERSLLVRRRPIIVSYWDFARERRPARFEAEAAALAGVASPTLDVLFEAMVESVETTAIQRGTERWAP